jgi:hypothetical protein
MKMGHSQLLTNDSSVSAEQTTLVGRPISAGAPTVQAYVFHSFSQLSQEDVALITAFLRNSLITNSYYPHITTECTQPLQLIQHFKFATK